MPREGAHWGPGWSPQEVHIPWPPQVPHCLLRPSLRSSSGPQPGPTHPGLPEQAGPRLQGAGGFPAPVSTLSSDGACAASQTSPCHLFRASFEIIFFIRLK